MMNGEETDGGISLGDMEKALVCLLMTSMEAPVQAESAGLTQEMFADASLGFVYEVIMKIYATGGTAGHGAGGTRNARSRRGAGCQAGRFVVPVALHAECAPRRERGGLCGRNQETI